ncbi:MAG: hypothetical protein GF329_10515 [Candidatus Lokiarchaeota archaeon]|nr:hypothetical protein [Candidatus Lokiarchaeota archaeon]
MAIFPILQNLGYYGDALLIMESIIVFLGFQFGFTFLRRYFRAAKGKKNYIILAWSHLFISFSTTLLFYIISDFFIIDVDFLRPQIVNIGYLAIVIGAISFSFYAEREMQSKFFPFTLIILTFLIVLIVDLFLNFIDTSFIALPSEIPIIILIFIYVNKFTAPIRSKWKLNVIGFIIGLIFVLTGFMFSSDIALNIWIGSRLLGDILIIIGMLLISFLFFGLPSLSEAKWIENLLNSHLYVIHKSGACIYEYNFSSDKEREKEENNDERSQIITGGLTGITQILSNMIKSNEKLEIVEVEDKKLFFTYGKYITVVLIVDEKLEILQSKLNKFLNYIEELFSPSFKSWNGEIQQFQILNKTIKQRFGLR